MTASIGEMVGSIAQILHQLSSFVKARRR